MSTLTIYFVKKTNNQEELKKCFDGKTNFFDLIQAEDLEDLLGLYLQSEKGYFVYPSTNKKGTRLYEYMLVNKEGKKALVQCKICGSQVSSEDINFFKHDHKDEDVYITTVADDDYNGENIHTIKTNILLDWCKKNRDILPQRIKNFLEFSKYHN